MTLTDTNHHDRCQVCGVRFLGMTDADVVEHFVEEHEEFGDSLATAIGLPRTETKECSDCGRQYVTHQGECPWCSERSEEQ